MSCGVLGELSLLHLITFYILIHREEGRNGLNIQQDEYVIFLKNGKLYGDFDLLFFNSSLANL